MAKPLTARNPLLLPELVRLILSFFASHKGDLASAIRVNKLWFDLVAPVLWDGAPWEALVGLEEHRRPEYAARMRRLICMPAPPLKSERALRDPDAARHRTVLQAEAARRNVMRQFFNLSLRDVVLLNFIDDAFLEDLGKRCCNLQGLLIDTRHGRLTYSAFENALSQLKSLERIVVLSICEPARSADLLIRLAEKPTLRSIRVRKLLTRVIMQHIKDAVPIPFKNLQTLQTRVASSAVPLLIEQIQNVTTLHLHVVGSCEVLQHVSRLVTLKSLEVEFYGRKSFKNAEIMALQRLHRLVTLRLCDGRRKRRALEDTSTWDLSSRDFANLLSSIGSDLHHLEFGLPCVIVDALSLVARYCPRLRELQIWHSPCHLPQPSDGLGPGATLNALRVLVVRSLGGDPQRDSTDVQRPSKYSQWLRDLMPELKFFMVTDRRSPDKLILTAFYKYGHPDASDSEDYVQVNGCPSNGCVGYGYFNTGYSSEEEKSDAYDSDGYHSTGHDCSDYDSEACNATGIHRSDIEYHARQQEILYEKHYLSSI